MSLAWKNLTCLVQLGSTAQEGPLLLLLLTTLQEMHVLLDTSVHHALALHMNVQREHTPIRLVQLCVQNVLPDFIALLEQLNLCFALKAFTVDLAQGSTLHLVQQVPLIHILASSLSISVLLVLQESTVPLLMPLK